MESVSAGVSIWALLIIGGGVFAILLLGVIVAIVVANSKKDQ